MTHTFPVGTTEPQDFQLLDSNLPINGTGLTPTIQVYYAATKIAVSPALTVAWLDQAAGTVRVTGAGALAIGTYLVRYRLTDGSALIGYAPNTLHADEWRVVTVATV